MRGRRHQIEGRKTNNYYPSFRAKTSSQEGHSDSPRAMTVNSDTPTSLDPTAGKEGYQGFGYLDEPVIGKVYRLDLG